MTRIIDRERITNAVMAAEVADGPARETGAELVDAWVDRYYEHDRVAFKVLAVEVPWFMWLDEHTLVVGMQDLLGEDEDGVFGGEWKTKRAPRVKRDGTYYKGDSEEEWIEEITNGMQCKIYSLAMRKASYVVERPDVTNALERARLRAGLWRLEIQSPRQRVRCVLKSSPPEFWPANGDIIASYDNSVLQYTEDALLARAAAIRGAQRSGKLPWAVPGIHCTNKFGRLCEYYDQFCKDRKCPSPESAPAVEAHDPNDPGSRAIAFSGADLGDLDLVILSASSYEKGSQCLEAYRLTSGGYGEKEESEALDVGTVLHAGVAEMLRMVAEEQAQDGEAAS